MPRLQVEQLNLAAHETAAQLAKRLDPAAAVVVAQRNDRVEAVRLADFQMGEDVQSLRAFDGAAECVLEHDGGQYRGQCVREASPGSPGASAPHTSAELQECEFVDRQTMIFGQVVRQEGAYAYMCEKRVNEFRLPIEAGGAAGVELAVRDYVGFDGDGSAYVRASRVVGFVKR